MNKCRDLHISSCYMRHLALTILLQLLINESYEIISLNGVKNLDSLLLFIMIADHEILILILIFLWKNESTDKNL